jgi:hypothetical protein
MAAKKQTEKPAEAGTPSSDAKIESPVRGYASYRAAHGLLIHPYTHAGFQRYEATPHALDSWVQAQLDAGKLIRAD